MFKKHTEEVASAAKKGWSAWKIALIILLAATIGFSHIGCKSIESEDRGRSEGTLSEDYTDPLTIEILLDLESYVGKEVTLTLDKAKFFPTLDLWEQTRKSVEQGGRIIYDGGYIVWWGVSPRIIGLMNIGEPVSIKGAKAIKLTGRVERVGRNESVRNARGIEYTIRRIGETAQVSSNVSWEICGEDIFRADYKLEAYRIEPIPASTGVESTPSVAPQPSPNTGSELIEGEVKTLLDQGVIETRVQGMDIKRIALELRRLVDQDVMVIIPAGTLFIAADVSKQNMVATRKKVVVLEDDEWIRVELPAACANIHREIPGEGDAFDVAPTASTELQKLAPYLEGENYYEVCQAAIWIVTDNASYDELGTLVYTGGGRVIDEEDTAKALKLLADAGIDVKSKRIWRDRYRIAAGIADSELKNWLESPS